MTTRSSRPAVFSVSTITAVSPPTSAFAAGHGVHRVAQALHCGHAASDSGGSARTARIRTHWPSADVSAGRTSATPGVAMAAAATCSAERAAAMMTAGERYRPRSAPRSGAGR